MFYKFCISLLCVFSLCSASYGGPDLDLDLKVVENIQNLISEGKARAAFIEVDKLREGYPSLYHYYYGYCHATGSCLDKDMDKGISHLTLSSELGHVVSMYALVRLLIENNTDEGLYWIDKASEGGSASASEMLGHSYATGQFVVKDTKKALIYYQRASDQGSEVAKKIIRCAVSCN